MTLTQTQIDEINKLHGEGTSMYKIAKTLGVSYTKVYYMFNPEKFKKRGKPVLVQTSKDNEDNAPETGVRELGGNDKDIFGGKDGL